jgi:hypothetical protein
MGVALEDNRETGKGPEMLSSNFGKECRLLQG